MARETKVEKGVHPARVDETIQLWQNFGWEVVGAPQEVYNKDTNSRLERRGDSLYSVTETETTHYFTISFQRDSSMPNYSKLKELEQSYFSISDPPPPPPKPKRIGIIFGIICAVLIGGFFAGLAEGFTVVEMLITIIFFPLPGIGILVWRFKRYAKLLPIWERQCAEYEKQCSQNASVRAEILKSTRILLA